jgi:hypothetical protein
MADSFILILDLGATLASSGVEFDRASLQEIAQPS